jgi:hypothetical protein
LLTLIMASAKLLRCADTWSSFGSHSPFFAPATRPAHFTKEEKSSRNLLVLEFAKALVHRNGPGYTGFTLKYIYSWGKGYK